MEKFLKFTCALALISLIYTLAFNGAYKFETPDSQEEETAMTTQSEEVDMWDAFIEAVIWKESKGDSNAIGDSGKAVGVLQIHPIMVREANRILALADESKANYYVYDDRYSREKSIEIFKIVQDYHNESHDFDKALQIWNHNHPLSYKTQIMAKYQELIS